MEELTIQDCSDKCSVWSKTASKKLKHSASDCCDLINAYSVLTKENRMNSANSSIVWNPSGWIRVYCGPYRDIIDCEEQSRMMHIISTASTESIIRDMEISANYTIWVIFGLSTPLMLELML